MKWLVVLTVLLLVGNLGKPFWGIHDWNGARYGTIARNYIQLGLVKTKLAQTENGEVNTHYPPLFPLLLAGSYVLFGVGEGATRLVPLIATSFSVGLLYLIGKEVWNWRVGMAAALLALATVVIRYFGTMPVHEPIAFTFALLAFWSVLTRRYKLMYLAAVLCLLTNWLGFYLVVGLTVLRGKQAWPLWLAAVGVFLVHLGHTWWVTGSLMGGGLWDIFLQRTALGGGAIYTPFTVSTWLHRLATWSKSLYSLWLLAAAASGSVVIWVKGSTLSQKL